MQPFRLLRFRNRIELESPPFPLRKPSQNGPRRQGFAPPRRNGAPLTAPGRSAKTFPNKRERRVGKSMALASKHLAVFQPHHARATTPRGTCTAAGGLDAETLRAPLGATQPGGVHPPERGFFPEYWPFREHVCRTAVNRKAENSVVEFVWLVKQVSNSQPFG